MSYPSRIRFKDGDFEIEVEGDLEFVNTRFDALLQLRYVSNPKTKVIIAEKETETGINLDSISIVEFYRSISPGNHDDRFVVFATWLKIHEGKDDLKTDDILNLYTKVSESKPANAAQHMASNVKRAFFERVADGMYRITKTGLSSIEDILKS